MKFSVDREKFAEAVSVASGPVKGNNIVTILGSLLFNLSADGLLVVGSSGNSESRSHILPEFVESGSTGCFALPTVKLVSIVRALPLVQTINFDIAESVCTLRAGRSVFKLSMADCRSFPLIDLKKIETSFKVTSAVFRGLTNGISFAMGNQDVRDYLNGAYVEISAQSLTLVATDGHRLSKSSHLWKDGVSALSLAGSASTAIIPRNAVMDLKRLLGTYGGDVEVSIAKNYLTVSFGVNVFTTILIDGRYPDYRRVLPEFNDNAIGIDVGLLKPALQRSMILANDKFKGGRFEFEKSAVSIFAQNPDQDESVEVVECAYAGEKIETAFNLVYVMDVVSSADQELLELKLKDSRSPCLVEFSDSALSVDYQHVIMPMRI